MAGMGSLLWLEASCVPPMSVDQAPSLSHSNIQALQITYLSSDGCCLSVFYLPNGRGSLGEEDRWNRPHTCLLPTYMYGREAT